MCETIFFAVPRNPELEIRIARFGGAAGGALVERFGLDVAGLHFEPPTSFAYILAMTR